MRWFVTFIIVVFLLYLLRFIFAYIKRRNEIITQGGIKTIYKVLVDGLLVYHSAKIVQENTNFITIDGTFTDCIGNRECGTWSITIQPTFSLLYIKYQAYTDIGGGEIAKQKWSFPINMNQEEILSAIKKKADQWDEYGIFK